MRAAPRAATTGVWIRTVALVFAVLAGRPADATDEVQLADGSRVEVVRFVPVRLPDGRTGREIVYRSDRPFDSDELRAEVNLVWWHFLPRLRSLGITDGVVVARRESPSSGSAGLVRSEAYRACLTGEGETLWIHLDGSLPPTIARAGKRCAGGSR